MWQRKMRILSTSLEPLIFQDRMDLSDLWTVSPQTAEFILDSQRSSVDSGGVVKFCGVVHLPGGRPTVFLPRCLPVENAGFPKLTMNTLQRFANEASQRQLGGASLVGNPNVVAIAVRLADDFRQNGLLTDRVRVAAKNSGKPNWSKTVSRSVPFLSSPSGFIYLDFLSSKVSASSHNLLTEVQAAVLREIAASHGWWIDGLESRGWELSAVPLPSAKRSLWPELLAAQLPNLYSVRAISLTNDLITYLRESSDSQGSGAIFGVVDFERVWEAMLIKTLVGANDGWNRHLPRAEYFPAYDSNLEPVERRMRMDLVVEEQDGYTIVDAKYYGALSADSLPGWSDIAKQMVYEMAFRSVVGDLVNVKNCFVFPTESEKSQRYESVNIVSATETRVLESFPKIDCSYVPIHKVMESYVNRSTDLKLNL